MKNYTKQYIKECKSILPIYSKDEKKFIKRLQENINLYENSHPNITYEDIKKNFGEPANIIMAYYQNIEMSELYAKIHKKKIIIGASIMIILILLFSSFFYSYTLYQEYRDFHDAVPTMSSDEIEIIE